MMKQFCIGTTYVLYIFPAIVFDTIVGALLTFGLYQRVGLYRRTMMPLIRLIILNKLSSQHSSLLKHIHRKKLNFIWEPSVRLSAVSVI